MKRINLVQAGLDDLYDQARQMAPKDGVEVEFLPHDGTATADPLVALVSPVPLRPLHREILHAAGIDLARTYVAHQHKWRLSSGAPHTPANDMAIGGQFFVDKELSLVRPALVVALGPLAAWHYFRATKAEDIYNQVFLKRGRMTTAVLHPEQVVKMRDPDSLKEQIQTALEAAAQIRAR